MGFLEETAREVLEFTTNAVFSERYARMDGLLQRIDPRVKVFSLVAIVATVVSLGRIDAILAFYFLALALAVLSRLPVVEFTKRVWVFIPIFTGVIALPSIFMIPGEPAFHLFGLTASREGIHWAVLFTLRVATAVSYAILFTMTSRWNDIVSALAFFRVPGMVITITTLTYRYIFLLAKLLLDAMHARRARLAGELGMVESWKEAGKHIGATFIKANSLGEDLYYAMLSRGYANEIEPLREFKAGTVDYAFSAFTVLLVVLTFAFTRGLL
ncbi:cobalt ECF transporter T component CbiQ [Thermococcus henrietii]|uniref:cobalt ECF transporter T component CbiQ n=1 Tax=Thermococcus henrietii TaxID=2016361 RepID=UPI000C079CB0|nr:cobalt ECF transporter T component CbiQ [Thermococcus henrietii]